MDLCQPQIAGTAVDNVIHQFPLAVQQVRGGIPAKKIQLCYQVYIEPTINNFERCCTYSESSSALKSVPVLGGIGSVAGGTESVAGGAVFPLGGGCDCGSLRRLLLLGVELSAATVVLSGVVGGAPDNRFALLVILLFGSSPKKGLYF
jgi:hypothetical protein